MAAAAGPTRQVGCPRARKAKNNRAQVSSPECESTSDPTERLICTCNSAQLDARALPPGPHSGPTLGRPLWPRNRQGALEGHQRGSSQTGAPEQSQPRRSNAERSRTACVAVGPSTGYQVIAIGALAGRRGVASRARLGRPTSGGPRSAAQLPTLSRRVLVPAPSR